MPTSHLEYTTFESSICLLEIFILAYYRSQTTHDRDKNARIKYGFVLALLTFRFSHPNSSHVSLVFTDKNSPWVFLGGIDIHPPLFYAYIFNCRLRQSQSVFLLRAQKDKRVTGKRCFLERQSCIGRVAMWFNLPTDRCDWMLRNWIAELPALSTLRHVLCCGFH